MVVVQEQSVGIAVGEELALLVVGVDDFHGLQLPDVDGEGGPAEMVRAPVGHAAAGIVAPGAPARAVDGEAAADAELVVGGPRRGTEPHVPIQPRGDRLAAQVAGLRQRIDVDVDRLDRSQLAAPARIDHAPVVFQHPLAAAGDHPPVTLRGLADQPVLAEGPRFGLLAEDVLAGPAGLDRRSARANDRAWRCGPHRCPCGPAARGSRRKPCSPCCRNARPPCSWRHRGPLSSRHKRRRTGRRRGPGRRPDRHPPYCQCRCHP